MTEAEAEELYETTVGIPVISIAAQVEPGRPHTYPYASHTITVRNEDEYYLEMSNENEPEQIGQVTFIRSEFEEYELARYIAKWISEERLQANFALYLHFRPEPFGENAESIETLKELLWVSPTGLSQKQIAYVDELLTRNDFFYQALLEFLHSPENYGLEDVYRSALEDLSLDPIFELAEGDTENENPIEKTWASISFSQLASMTSGLDGSAIGETKFGRVVIDETLDEEPSTFFYFDLEDKVQQTFDWIRFNFMENTFATQEQIVNAFACEIVRPTIDGVYPNLIAAEVIPISIEGPDSEFHFPEDHCEDFADEDSRWEISLDEDPEFRAALLKKLKSDFEVPHFEKFYVLDDSSEAEQTTSLSQQSESQNLATKGDQSE